MPKAVLAGLKKREEISLSVICSVSDTGGSAGKEREKYGTNISFGDIRRSFLELSEIPPDIKDVLTFRVKDGTSGGTVIANILGTAAVLQSSDYEKAFKTYREILKVSPKYQVFPATLDDATICAVLENGQIIREETNIDIPKHDSALKIKNVYYLEPKPRGYPKAVEALKEADLIVIGPGDLYSSLSQILLVEDISASIRESGAKKVYICNLMTKDGETNNFSVEDFTGKIEKFIGCNLDYVIYNTEKPSADRTDAFKEKRRELLKSVEINENLDERKFIGKNLLTASGDIIHDPEKVAEAILSL